MPVSLSNSKDIVANSISLVRGNRLIDVLETIDAVQVLAPETLSSLEKLANALNNDSNYFQTVSGAISNKADAATTYTKTEVDNNILNSVNDLEDILWEEIDTKADQATTYTKTEVDGQLVLKQNTLTAGTVQGGVMIMQDGIVRAMKGISPVWLAPDVNFVAIGVDLNNYATNTALATKQNTLTAGTGLVFHEKLLEGTKQATTLQ